MRELTPKEEMMQAQVRFALDHPVYDPERQIIKGHYWVVARAVTGCLTVNIGEE
jgi:hypothetical protein